MTHEQYERWKDFSLRMARTCVNKSRRPSAAWIIAQVEDWFSCRDYQEDWKEYTSWDQDEHPLCDHVSEFWESDIPFGNRCRACSQSRYGDDYNESLTCRCDEIEYMACDQFTEQWLGPIRCCLRAGIDVACETSTGVVGFTAGDLRRMYPEGVPEWVSGGNEKWCPWLTKEHDETQCHTFSELPDDRGVVL